MLQLSNYQDRGECCTVLFTFIWWRWKGVWVHSPCEMTNASPLIPMSKSQHPSQRSRPAGCMASLSRALKTPGTEKWWNAFLLKSARTKVALRYKNTVTFMSAGGWCIKPGQNEIYRRSKAFPLLFYTSQNLIAVHTFCGKRCLMAARGMRQFPVKERGH